MAIITGSSGGGAPTGAAGGDLGGTYPNPSVTGGTHLTAASVAIASLADPTTGKVIGSAANAAAAVFPPGFEIGYDQITSSVNIAGTTQAGGTTIITCAAHTFDGGPVLVEFYSGQVGFSTVASNALGVTLNETGAAIADLAFVRIGVATSPQGYAAVCAKLRFTPTAASHSYVITAYSASVTGTPFIGAGAGTAGAVAPAYVRFTKV